MTAIDNAAPFPLYRRHLAGLVKIYQARPHPLDEVTAAWLAEAQALLQLISSFSERASADGHRPSVVDAMMEALLAQHEQDQAEAVSGASVAR